jgi:hypothetical protein
VVRFEAMIELYHKWMVQLRAYIFFVLHYVLFLVLANKLLQHHLHGVELAVPQAADQVDLTESTYGKALEHLIFLETALSDKLDTVEG